MEVLQSNNPNNEQGKCQITEKMGSKVIWPRDKYELALQVKNKDRLQLAKSDLTYQKWAEQNPDNFGFIPLGPLLLPKTNNKHFWDTDSIKLYDITRNEDTFNFMCS